MIDLLQNIMAFIVVISVLVSFHEFGHFWVARKCDVKILVFSIGFGKPLWSKRFGKDQCSLVIAALPLGGYVKMLDEREQTVAAHELHRAFNRKSLLQRSVIVLAGPVFNFIFAVMAFWLMFMIGLTGLKPMVGAVAEDSIAYHAGLHEGIEIIAVESDETRTWTMVANTLLDKMLVADTVEITVSDNSGINVLSLNTVGLSLDDIAQQDLLNKLGITPQGIKAPAIIGKVQPGLPAAKVGLIPHDLIVSADDIPVADWQQWVSYVQAHPEQKITMQIQRTGRYLTLDIIPDRKITNDGKVIGFIGAANRVENSSALLAKESYGLIQAFLMSIERTWDMSWLTLRILGKMVSGQISAKNLSGPISIAQYAGNSAQLGIAAFLWFLGIISISLGVLNLLPIPLLDGGHLLYYTVEFLKGSPVSESVQAVGQQIGLMLLLGIMTFVFYNDIERLVL